MATFQTGPVNVSGVLGNSISLSVLAPANTFVTGVDAAGDVVGYYSDNTGDHGFIRQGSTITPIDVAAAASTVVTGVNAAGAAFGYYSDNTGTHGFIDQGGTITPINVAGASQTFVTGVDSAGDAVGYYQDNTGMHSFIDQGGTITPINVTEGATATAPFPPYKLADNTVVTGDGNFGYYYDNNGIQHGFIGNTPISGYIIDHGIFITQMNAAVRSVVTGVDAGYAVGNYYDYMTGKVHGFWTDNGYLFNSINVAGATNTVVNGINATGAIFGYYSDNTGTHGFIDQSGTITPINVAGASQTTVTGVDAAGDAVGIIRTIPARMASSAKAALLRRPWLLL